MFFLGGWVRLTLYALAASIVTLEYLVVATPVRSWVLGGEAFLCFVILFERNLKLHRRCFYLERVMQAIQKVIDRSAVVDSALEVVEREYEQTRQVVDRVIRYGS